MWGYVNGRVCICSCRGRHPPDKARADMTPSPAISIHPHKVTTTSPARPMKKSEFHGVSVGIQEVPNPKVFQQEAVLYTCNYVFLYSCYTSIQMWCNWLYRLQLSLTVCLVSDFRSFVFWHPLNYAYYIWQFKCCLRRASAWFYVVLSFSLTFGYIHLAKAYELSIEYM